jgi:hypothetical protein
MQGPNKLSKAGIEQLSSKSLSSLPGEGGTKMVHASERGRRIRMGILGPLLSPGGDWGAGSCSGWRECLFTTVGGGLRLEGEKDRWEVGRAGGGLSGARGSRACIGQRRALWRVKGDSPLVSDHRVPASFHNHKPLPASPHPGSASVPQEEAAERASSNAPPSSAPALCLFVGCTDRGLVPST